MSALHRIQPGICFDIYTTAPRWFFEESLSGAYTYTPEVYYTRKFSDKYILFPIPQSEIDKNQNLENNPGF